MLTSCTTAQLPAGTPRPAKAHSILEAPAILCEVVRRHGTPTYAYDVNRIRNQVLRLREHFPREVDVLYSLKANASLGLCGVLAECGLGADVASAGELITAVAAGFPPERLFLTGPDKSPAVLAQLASLPGVMASLDSVSELRLFATPLSPPFARGVSGGSRSSASASRLLLLCVVCRRARFAIWTDARRATALP